MVLAVCRPSASPRESIFASRCCSWPCRNLLNRGSFDAKRAKLDSSLVAPPEQIPYKASHQNRSSEEPAPFGNADQPDEQEPQNNHQFNGMARPNACSKPAERDHLQRVTVFMRTRNDLSQGVASKRGVGFHKNCSSFQAKKGSRDTPLFFDN